MDLTPETVAAALSERLMIAVARSGAVTSDDTTRACEIMREELKALVCGGTKYADERYLILTGNDVLAWGSFVAEVLRRIVVEKREAGFSSGLQVKESATSQQSMKGRCDEADDKDD